MIARRLQCEHTCHHDCGFYPGAVPTKAANPAVPVTPSEQIEATQADYEQGGHVRAGLEDNLKYDHTRLADSNAALMAQVAALGAQDARYPATPAEARLIRSFPALPSRPRREENHE